ncbi:hypothetical protein MASR2M17_16430 [Aminivibrio sp.]
MKRKGIGYLYEKKQRAKKCRTALYDYPMACIAEKAGIEIINVGDSIAMVTLGYEDTLGCLDIMVECEGRSRGAPTAFIMGDSPLAAIKNLKRKLFTMRHDICKRLAWIIKIRGEEIVSGREAAKSILSAIGLPSIY